MPQGRGFLHGGGGRGCEPVGARHGPLGLPGQDDTAPCPDSMYGGTERVVSYLTEELVTPGHEVTLFASLL